MNVGSIAFDLTAARRQAGLTQRDVAERMGTTQSAVSRVESGRAQPTTEFLDRYARALGRTITVTFGASEANLPPRGVRMERVRRVLGDRIADPWARNPSPEEQQMLEAAGLSRERFRRAKTARAR